MKHVIKDCFVILLIKFWNCKIDVKYEEDKKVKSAMKRDIRENMKDNFDCEIISI